MKIIPLHLAYLEFYVFYIRNKDSNCQLNIIDKGRLISIFIFQLEIY